MSGTGECGAGGRCGHSSSALPPYLPPTFPPSLSLAHSLYKWDIRDISVISV